MQKIEIKSVGEKFGQVTLIIPSNAPIKKGATVILEYESQTYQQNKVLFVKGECYVSWVDDLKNGTKRIYINKKYPGSGYNFKLYAITSSDYAAIDAKNAEELQEKNRIEEEARIIEEKAKEKLKYKRIIFGVAAIIAILFFLKF